MPRKRRGIEERPRFTETKLAERLAEELRSDRQSGQPVIDEQEFPTGKLRVTVVWDAWDSIPMEERTAAIMRAYDVVEGQGYSDRIALVSGLTVPEAYSAGMLPFQIITALRKSDPITPEQCRQAMIEEGASILFAPDKPQLRFASEDEAEAARQRLIKRLRGSDEVWVVTQEMGKVEDWAQA